MSHRVFSRFSESRIRKGPPLEDSRSARRIIRFELSQLARTERAIDRSIDRSAPTAMAGSRRRKGGGGGGGGGDGF